jgi:large subunit ribosomal protein L35
MPKTKTRKGAAKRFSVTGTGKIMRRRRHRTTPPGHLVKSSPGKRKRGRQGAQVAPSDRNALRKMLGF